MHASRGASCPQRPNSRSLPLVGADQRWVVLDENKLYYRQGNRKEQVRLDSSQLPDPRSQPSQATMAVTESLRWVLQVLVRSQDSWTQAMVRKISYTEFELATIRGRFIFRAAKPAMAQVATGPLSAPPPVRILSPSRMLTPVALLLPPSQMYVSHTALPCRSELPQRK